jgi:hypothetical protein
MSNTNCRIWIGMRNSEKPEYVEMQNVGHGIWRENRKRRKMRQKHCIIWNVAIKTE